MSMLWGAFYCIHDVLGAVFFSYKGVVVAYWRMQGLCYGLLGYMDSIHSTYYFFVYVNTKNL